MYMYVSVFVELKKIFNKLPPSLGARTRKEVYFSTTMKIAFIVNFMLEH